MVQRDLFGDIAVSTLDEAHYLGARGARPRFTYSDADGVLVFSGPTSRRLPSAWLELSRWCIVSGVGSRQWAQAVSWLRRKTTATTVVSYSDPSVGHDGALYRASGWVWAPTWHVLREPPTGCGLRGGQVHRAKHRWVYLLREDPAREAVLALRDEALEARFPWVGYREPQWKRGRPQIDGQRFRWVRWMRERRGPGE